MSRTLTAAVQSEIVASFNSWRIFAQFDFASGLVNLWDGPAQLITSSPVGTLPAATWTAAGSLGTMSPIEETSGLVATGVTFELTGIAASLLQTALGEHYQGRNCQAWLAYFDASGTLIGDPVRVVNGKMDEMELRDTGGVGTIKLSVENRTVDLGRPADPSFYTDADQKRRFPGDRGLEYVAKLQNKTIFWGREALKPGKGTGRDGTYGSDPGGLIPGQDTIRPGGGGPPRLR